MNLIALLEHCLGNIGSVEKTPQHLTVLKWMAKRQYMNFNGIHHAIRYVGFHRHQLSMPFVPTLENLSLLLMFVPSLFAQAPRERRTTAMAQKHSSYKFIVWIDKQHYLITGHEGGATGKNFHVTNFEMTTEDNILPIFYICSGHQGYFDMLNHIQEDYEVKPNHVAEIKPSEDHGYKFCTLAMSPFDVSWHCKFCDRRAICSEDNNSDPRQIIETPVPNLLVPRGPLAPLAQSTTPSGVYTGHRRHSIPFDVQNPTTPLIEREHPHGCCCFKCGCCSIQ